jgi:hypothetical protein
MNYMFCKKCTKLPQINGASVGNVLEYYILEKLGSRGHISTADEGHVFAAVSMPTKRQPGPQVWNEVQTLPLAVKMTPV